MTEQTGIVPSYALDIGIAIVVLAYAVSGYRRGFFLSFVSALGFALGAVAAWWFLPSREDAVLPDRLGPLRHIVLLVAMVLAGTLGQIIVLWIARLPYQSIRRTRARTLDSVLGSVVVAFTATAMVWFVAGVARLTLADYVGTPIKNSRVLSAIDAAMPDSSDRLITRTLGALKDSGFPRVFGEDRLIEIAPVGPPDAGLAASPLVLKSQPSVVPIHASAPQCRRSQEGTGWVIQPGVVVTNAHVVAGSDDVEVGRGQARRNASVLAFDAQRDLAVLRVPGLTAPPLPLGSTITRGEHAIVLGYPLGGAYRADPARVRGELVAEGEDIYGTSPSRRSVISLRASIQPGNSGGPLLSSTGSVVGVIFARSVSDTSTAYALSLSELTPVMNKASAGQRVGTGGCT